MAAGEGVAIVGWAGRFPGAGPDKGRFWELVRDGRDAAGEPPAGRWHLPPARCVRPGGPHPDKVPHARGYFLEPFTAEAPGLPADWLGRLDPLFHLALDLGRRAWQDAKTDNIDRKRAGVILGNICLPTDQSNALARDLLGGPRPAADTHPWNRYVAGLPAGLVARSLGLGHLAFTLDAACASSLYAVKLACDELIEGRADLMLAGGLNRADSQYTQMGFAQLRALSAGGRCAPFDRRADGLMVGEGGGVFVLKRLADAERDGDRVRAVVRGWGLSNDIGANLLAPAVEGQLRAMRAAYQCAGWAPEDVDLIECHATGTPVGDAVEFRSLRELWGHARRPDGACLIGSVKSTVGHLLTGAGAAALAKVLLSLEHETRPAQANFAEPNPDLAYDDGPFRVPAAPVPWERRAPETPRRAAVSGFGFGGVNAHLLIEEYIGFDPARVAVPAAPPAEPIAVVGVGARVGPWAGPREFSEWALGGGELIEPAPKRNGWGDAPEPSPAGFYREEMTLPRGAFRTPPKELAAMLPQQLLALQACADALAASGQPDRAGPDPRTGVFLGVGLDLNTTNYHLRWAALAADPNAPPDLLDAITPPLDADRTMGALGSVAASRVARAFELGGPSFTCCSEESSSGRALELAVRALRRGEIDRAVVGGIDLAGDPRAVIATREAWPEGAGTPGEGAAAVVLRRLKDAEALGEPIVALVTGVGSAVGGAGTKLGPTPENAAEAVRVACAEANIKEKRLAFVDDAGSAGGTAGRCGNAGMAAGAVAVARAVSALRHHILPPAEGRAEPAFWLHDTAAGPRRAAVRTAGADGTVCVAVLEEYTGSAAPPPDAQPLGARPEALFALEGADAGELVAECDRLAEWLIGRDGRPVERLARDWFAANRPRPGCRQGVAFVARSGAELAEQVAWARGRLPEWRGSEEPGTPAAARDRVFHAPEPTGPGGKVALVFPGSGNHFAGMGRDLGAHFPAILRRQQSESTRLRSQFSPALFWADAVPDYTTAKQFLFGQVTAGALVADLVKSLGVRPGAMLGLSLGESAGLFGVRVWTARDEMFKRIETSKLFGPELGRPFDSARRAWKWPTGKPLPWLTAVLAAPPERIQSLMREEEKAYLLIVNTPGECVVGGLQEDVEGLAARVGGAFVPLTGVTLAHCEAGRPAEVAYRALHTLPAAPVWGVTLYSGARAEPYPAESGAAADSITAGLVGPIDFPKLVRRAHADGVRAFVEVGPGNSCTRMIGAILANEPHLARAATAPRQSGVSLLLRLLAALVAERYPVDLAALYGQPSACAGHAEPAAKPADAVSVPVGRAGEDLTPRPPSLKGRGSEDQSEPGRATPPATPPLPPIPAPLPFREGAGGLGSSPADGLAAVVAAVAGAQATAAEAHDLFLRVQAGFTEVAAAALRLHAALLTHAGDIVPSANGHVAAVPRSLSTKQCFAFARGKIADVLGPLFAEVDAHPTRVRLPDGPLMLVDRVLEIEGEPRSLKPGRVVTDHAVTADRWYLDAGRIPTCIAVESGQADLFLSGFLGIDFETKGRAVYRLIDAVVTFHRALPGVGDVIRYDIRIDEFVKQGDAWLFRFRFEATVNGEPLMSMTNGVAGFFTAEALAGGQGIVKSRLDKQPMAGKKPADWRDWVPPQNGSLDALQVAALRRGDLAGAFGPAFAAAKLTQPMTLPGGMLRLLDRVPLLEPAGGRFGLGFVRAEYDIAPDDWFLTCHFVDDQVMPGTLMYECCLHTLRVLLMNLGWVGEEGEVATEPVPGRSSRLKCRGQVIASTKLVTYEVTVKELGYGPEPFCVADALMFADGKPIVEIGDMTLRMSGLSREKLEAIWGDSFRAGSVSDGSSLSRPSLTLPARKNGGRTFDKASILAYSNGAPSEAFGEPYRVFDRDRILARLPGPPYQFVDRVASVTGEPFVMAAGAACVAEYDVPPSEWYFDANRCGRMPLSILLEIALQPCGWLAAYCGSALTSDEDLSFRNLGGQATQHRAVGPDAGTLTTSVQLMNVSKSAGMIIQHYSMSVRDRDGVVYDGTTYFGFFTKPALANQVGMTAAKVPYLTDEQKAAAGAGELPREAPFPAPMLRMVDRIDGYLPDGGAQGLGLVQGSIAVDPDFWFFAAHFYQDPVWPGSLGLESFLQLLKYAAWKRWGDAPPSGWQATALGAPHSWQYRGQVLPADGQVTVVLEVTAIDEERRRLAADGYLTVDGRVIYQMTDFTLE